MSQSFAQKFVSLSVRAARRSNHLAIVTRRNGTQADIEQALLFREMAKANMQEAKARKRDARINGDW